MGVYDFENERGIINPFISLSYKYEGGRIYLNTSTFGNRCQERLILPRERKLMDELFDRDNFFTVKAIIGSLEYPSKNNLDDLMSRQVVFHIPLISTTFLGYLEGSVIKKYLPKSFEELTKKE